ncbi:MAG: PBSX family phage terminase large subunit [Gallionellaceae bacterium]
MASIDLSIDTAPVYAPLLQKSRYKGAYGGRGSAKSHFFAELLIEECVSRRIKAVCIREIQKSLAQSVKSLLELKIESMGIGKLFKVQDAKITCKNGSIIIFQGMQDHTADSIKSLEGFDIAWVEEAQSLSQRSLDLLRPTIRKPGSELWFSWNPENKDDPIDEFLRCDNPPPDSIVVKANYRDNPWLPDVLKAEIEYDRNRDPDKYAHVWLGKYISHSSSRVFRNWSVDKFTAPRGSEFRFGADWGFSNDPSVLVRGFVSGRTLYIDHEAYLVGCEINQLPDLFDTVPESNKWFITADSARPETISYMQKHGFPRMKSAKKGSGSIVEGVEFIRAHDVVIHPRCVHTIDEFTLYSYKTDKRTGEVTNLLEDKNNHVIDSIRYLLEGVRRAVKKRRTARTHERVADTVAGY